jgi:glycosyltransferase involved in cell wall biosynthesis
MIRVAALTSGRAVSSRRFRVEQHIDPLSDYGIAVTEYVPRISKYAPAPAALRALSIAGKAAWHGAKLGFRLGDIAGSWRADVTWLEREFYPGYVTFEPLLRKPLVLDVDDAIWLSAGESVVRRIARNASVVMAGNSFLGDWFSQYVADVRIVPTAIDTNRFHPAETPPQPFTIGWTGSKSTLPYLAEIEGPLDRVLRLIPEAELLIVCDVRPRFRQLDERRVRFVPWSAGIEAACVREMSVGVMPLPDTDWARGKCSFKMLQYMACAVPVVVSPIGMNAEILDQAEVGVGAGTEADWVDALMMFAGSRQEALRRGANGRAVVLERYSRSVVTGLLAEVFRSVGGSAQRA